MHVLFDTSPLNSGHAHRGIGIYTSLLSQELKNIPEIDVSFSLSEAKNKTNKIDVVHYPFFDLFFQSLPFFRPAKKSVVTIHDVIPLQFKEHYPVGKKGAAAHLMQRLALHSVNAIITDSISSQKALEEFLNISTDKISVVYLAGNPLMSHQTDKVVSDTKLKYSLPEKYVLYVGDINYNKNIPQLIKSLKYLDESIHLVLFGKNFIEKPIPEWQWIETQVALSNVVSRVHFLTSVQGAVEQELSALYSGAVAYVQPSLAEGFGLPVLEAMQCKVPVIASETTSLPEVGGAQAFYCEPTAESIAQSVKIVTELSKAETKRRTEAAYEWSQKFSWRKTAEETVKVYESLF